MNQIQIRVQSFGRFLSNMIMPNIGAFIAWGFITALFIPSGWFPNEMLGKLVGPMITYLLPLLIGYTGGKLIGGERGAVVGAITTMGIIVGADIPMFLGAMIVGPLGGYAMKKFDQFSEGKIKSGFEMLVNNFSVGIIGMVLAIIAFFVISPLVIEFSKLFAIGVNFLVDKNLLPLTSIIVEPAKVLFLNNAINHGIFTPLGTQQATEFGKSIFFLIEANPGPGLGILLAYSFFGKGDAKSSAPGAIIIHFFGGIHEIYFPYVLMKPRLILAAIAGGATGILVLTIFNAGLVSPASPGSIFAILLMTPKGSYLGVILSILSAAVVSFIVASILLKTDNQEAINSFEEATSKIKDLKNASKLEVNKSDQINSATFDKSKVHTIVVACDAGMGSSAMGASLLRKKVEASGLDYKVINKAINSLTDDDMIVLTHETLVDRAKKYAPHAKIFSLSKFIASPTYDDVVEFLKNIDHK